MSMLYYEIQTTREDNTKETFYYPADKYTGAEALAEAKKEAPGCEVGFAGMVMS